MKKCKHLQKMVARSAPRSQLLSPSAHLDVEVTRRQQAVILNPTPQDYTMQEIAATCHGEAAKQNMPKRKLDALGFLRGESGIQNGPLRLKRLKNQLALASSLAEISKQNDDSKALQTSETVAKLIEMAPDALIKLKDKGDDPAKLTMLELKAIAHAKFGGQVLTGNKQNHVDAIVKLRMAQPAVIGVNPPSHMLTNTTKNITTDTTITTTTLESPSPP